MAPRPDLEPELVGIPRPRCTPTSRWIEVLYLDHPDPTMPHRPHRHGWPVMPVPESGRSAVDPPLTTRALTCDTSLIAYLLL